MIFDEHTGQVSGERQVALRADSTGIQAGGTIDVSAVTTTVVDSAP